MKNVNTQIANPVKVRISGNSLRAANWAQIICATTGQVKHTGQVRYIKRVAKSKYGVKVG